MHYARELQRQLQSEVLFDPVSLALYSVDASIYELTPTLVVLPRSQEDIQKTVAFAKQHLLPITARGAGTNTTGNCLGRGIIIDCSRHLKTILSFNQVGQTVQTVTVQPGITLDAVNRALAPYNLQIGPDVSTSDRATIGGMLACNAAGVHSLQYGSMRDAIRSVKMVTANGAIIDTATHVPLEQLKNKYQKTIENEFPKFPRISSGYYLPALLENRLDKLIAGSEGTLGIATEIELAVVPKKPLTYLYLIHYKSLHDAFKAIPQLLQLHPLALELLDDKIVEIGRSLQPDLFTETCPALILEADRELQFDGIVRVHAPDTLWKIRTEALGLLLKSSHKKPIGFIEDMAVPPGQLPAFYRDLEQIFTKYNVRFGIYGHVGAGCIHIRPFLDPALDRQAIDEIAHQAISLVKRYRGVFSSEHGDGLVRSWANPALFGEMLFEAMREVKEYFDPSYILNPGKIVAGRNAFTQPLFDNLRNNVTNLPFTPFFEGYQQGKLESSVDRCNGNGKCRKEAGLMCPSFQATGDERDSTRARAVALRSIATGALSPEELHSEELYKVFDLCLSCKGCSTECPASIDVSKLKAEYLFQRNRQSFRDWLFANAGSLLHSTSYLPTFITSALSKLCGLSHMPKIAPMRFSAWAHTQGLLDMPLMTSSASHVALFIDTFTEFLEPEVGKKAVSLLQRLGFKVVVLPWSCCGRTKISKGYLPAARKSLLKLQKQFERINCPIVTLEPSCQSVFIDEAPFMGIPFKRVVAIQDFLLAHKEQIAALSQKRDVLYLFHGHCHEKSIIGTKSIFSLLKALPGATVQSISEGCCGMAGAFGYEKEHEAISKTLFEKELLNALSGKERIPQGVVIANGISCRQQIQRRANIKAYHFIEVLANQMGT